MAFDEPFRNSRSCCSWGAERVCALVSKLVFSAQHSVPNLRPAGTNKTTLAKQSDIKMWLASTRTNPDRAITLWSCRMKLRRVVGGIHSWAKQALSRDLLITSFCGLTPKGGLRVHPFNSYLLVPPLPSSLSLFFCLFSFLSLLLSSFLPLSSFLSLTRSWLCGLDCPHFYLNLCKVEQVLRSLCQINLEPVFPHLKPP